MKKSSQAILLAIAWGCALILWPASPLCAQPIPKIPTEWAVHIQNAMNASRALLMKHFKEHNKKVNDLNAHCGVIPPDATQLLSDCQKEAALIDEDSIVIDGERKRFLNTFHDNERIYAAYKQSKENEAKLDPNKPPYDHAIDIAYKNAPPGVSDKVRQAFQAAAANDWEKAKVMFQDALKLDTDNEGLQKFIKILAYTPGVKPVNNAIAEKIPVPAIFNYVPTSEEIKAYVENGRALDKGLAESGQIPDLPYEASAFSEKFRKFVSSIDAEDLKKFDAYCEYAADNPGTNIPSEKMPVLTTGTYVPTSDEIKAFQSNYKADGWKPTSEPPGGFSEKFKNYISSLNDDEMEKFLSIQLPKEEDLPLLFQVTLPGEKDINQTRNEEIFNLNKSDLKDAVAEKTPFGTTTTPKNPNLNDINVDLSAEWGGGTGIPMTIPPELKPVKKTPTPVEAYEQKLAKKYPEFNKILDNEKKLTNENLKLKKDAVALYQQIKEKGAAANKDDLGKLQKITDDLRSNNKNLKEVAEKKEKAKKDYSVSDPF